MLQFPYTTPDSILTDVPTDLTDLTSDPLDPTLRPAPTTTQLPIPKPRPEPDTSSFLDIFDLEVILPYLIVIGGGSLFVIIGCCLFCPCFKEWLEYCLCSIFCCCFSSGQTSADEVQREEAPDVPQSGEDRRQSIVQVVPQRQQIAVRPSRHVSDVHSIGRRPTMSVHYSQAHQVAPPAARQVARTVKIIGNILTSENTNKRRR